MQARDENKDWIGEACNAEDFFVPKFSLLLALVGCGEKTAVEESSPPDAERPYAEPAAPPAHTDVATTTDLKSTGNDAIDTAALEELSNETNAAHGKVDNVTSSEAPDEKAAIY